MAIIRKCSLLICLIFFGISFNPTSGYAEAAADQQKALLTRANEYWNLLLEKKLEKAHTYEDPASVQNVAFSQYAQRFGGGVKWLGVRAEKAQIDGNEADVLMKIRYVWSFTPEVPEKGFEGTFFERWRLIDGQWFHVYRKANWEKLKDNKTDKTGSDPQSPAPNPESPTESKQ